MKENLFLFTIIIWMVSPAHSAVLECSWDPQIQYCSPVNITPVTQPNEVITINGMPSNYVNYNTTSAWFYNQVINYMPSGLLTLFPKLQSLSIERCEMTSLTTDSIPNCGELGQFSMRGGTFTSIPAGVFQSCKSLTFLAFGETNVTTVDVDAFRGLNNLTMINIVYSKLSCLPLGLFKHNPILNYVYFYGNLITSIDSNLFANLPMLYSIGLGMNLLSYIPMLNLTTSAVGSPNYSPSSSVDFSSNPIYAIAPDFCSIIAGRAENTLYVNIYNISCMDSNNQINGISTTECQNSIGAFQNCFSNWTSAMAASIPCGQPPTTIAPTTLATTTIAPTPGTCPSDRICRYFLDQFNRYTCILDGVDSVLTSISGNHLITFADINVRRVIFTNSFLSRIPPILFQKFSSLEYLTVSNCSMSALNTNTFTACGTLKYFDASNNFITTVDGASFKSCAALEVIDLTGNNFDMISGQLFVNNPTLKAVYINRPPAMVLV